MKKPTDENKKIAMEFLNNEIEKKLASIANAEKCLLPTHERYNSEYNTRCLINNTCLDIITLFDALYDCCYTDDSCNGFKCFEWGFRLDIVDKQKYNKSICDRINNDVCVSDLGLIVSTANLLKKQKINKLYQIIELTEIDLYKIDNINKKRIFEIKEMLESRGLNLSPVTRC